LFFRFYFSNTSARRDLNFTSAWKPLAIPIGSRAQLFCALSLPTLSLSLSLLRSSLSGFYFDSGFRFAFSDKKLLTLPLPLAFAFALVGIIYCFYFNFANFESNLC